MAAAISTDMTSVRRATPGAKINRSGFSRLIVGAAASQRAGSFTRNSVTSETTTGARPQRNMARQPNAAPTVKLSAAARKKPA